MTETKRMADGRLRITLDEAGEVALLTMAAIAMDIVTAPREDDPEARTDEKLDRLKAQTEQIVAFTEAAIFPPPLRTETMATPDEIRAMCDEVTDDRWPWVRLAGQHWVQVTAVSSRPGNDRAFIHYRATNGDELAKDVATTDQFAVTTETEMALAEGRAA